MHCADLMTVLCDLSDRESNNYIQTPSSAEVWTPSVSLRNHVPEIRVFTDRYFASKYLDIATKRFLQGENNQNPRIYTGITVMETDLPLTSIRRDKQSN